MSQQVDQKKRMRPFGAAHHRGQALAEYALIIAFVVLAVIGIIALTGPAVGNVFSNAVANLLYQTLTPYDTISPNELEDYLTAVASYTPATRPPKTPLVPLTLTPSDTPFGTLAPTFTYTPTRTPTVTPSPSPTGSSPTPVDQQLNVGQAYQMNHIMQLGSSENAGNYWHYDSKNEPSRLRAFWQAEYFNTASPSPSGPVVATDNIFSHLSFYWGLGSPKAGVNADGFTVRYTALDPADGTAGIPFFVDQAISGPVGVANPAGQRWAIRVTANKYARVDIDGVPVVTLTAPDADTVTTKIGYYSASSSGKKSVQVITYDDTSNASIEVSINRVSDYGDCAWNLVSNENRSPSLSWADSQDAAYAAYKINSSCTLRQRGWYDLTGVANPRLIFWNRWKLNTGDSLQVGVREYDNPASNWTWFRVQKAIGTNFNWNRQVMDLTNMQNGFDDLSLAESLGAQPSTETEVRNFTNEKIEIAFRVVSDSANSADGWYLDDVGVFDWNAPDLGFPYTDEVDATTLNKWVNECNWQVVSDSTAGARLVWRTTPATNPTSQFGGAYCPLMMDGTFTIPAVSSDLPLLEFDSKVALSAGDDIRVEVGDASLPDLWTNPASWESVPAIGGAACVPTLPPLPATCIYQGSVNKPWETLKVDLQAYRGKTIYIRFVLLADTNQGSVTTSDGWWVDKIRLRFNTVAESSLPFIEPFSATDNWDLSGWSLTGGADPVRSNSTALTDSPGGANYATNSSPTALLKPALRTVGSVRPIVSFYTRWAAPTANLTLDYSWNDGFTWKPIWNYTPGTLGSENRAWERFEIELLPLLQADSTVVFEADGKTIQTGPRIMFRFRMLATGVLPVADGFYIDDFRVESRPTTTVTLTAVNNYTYTDNMNSSSSADNWHYGGKWAWQSTSGRPDSAGGSTGGWSDSPGTNYDNPQRSIIEFVPDVDTTQAETDTKLPAIVFWTRYGMGSGHNYSVEVKPDGGTWTEVWDNINTAGSPTNVGWHRVVIPVETSWAQPFRVRFKLDAMDSVTASEGISLDEFQIIGRDTWTNYGTLPPGLETMQTASNWLLEGSWKMPTVGVTGTPLWGPTEIGVGELATITTVSVPGDASGFGNTTATSDWVGNYWHTNSATYWTAPYGQVVDWTSLLATAPTINGQLAGQTLDLDFGANPTTLPVPVGTAAWSAAGPAHDEWYALRWRRKLGGSGGNYIIRLVVTGGVDLLINGAAQTPDSTLPRPYVSSGSSPTTADPSRRTFYYRVAIGGNTTIEVRFWHSTNAISGPGYLQLAMAEQEAVGKSSPLSANYTHLTRTSMILNGFVTVPPNDSSFVSYRERWSLGQTDVAAAYYSVNQGESWIEVGSTRREANSPDATGASLQDWQTTSYTIPNPSAFPLKVILKWELDARVNTEVADGWLIDDVVFQTGASVGATPPTSASLVYNLLANTASAWTPPTVVDPNLPFDYFKVAVTLAPKRGTAAITVTGPTDTDTVRYTPFGDWTGTETFGFNVTDSGGATIPGGAVGTVTVDPRFAAGFDIGDTSAGAGGVIDGNTWIAQNGTATDSSGGNISMSVVTGTAGGLGAGAITGSTSSTQAEMLQDYVADSNLAVDVAIDDGTYSVYLYFVASETTAQTFDVFLTGRNDPTYPSTAFSGQIVDNLTMGAQGTWTRVGPYTIKTNHATLLVRTTGGIAALAGIDIYEGGVYTNFTSMDISPRTELGNPATLPGSTTVGSGTISMTAYGWDIWANNDGFRYVYKAEYGDLDVIARLDSADLSSDGWAKVGIMFRFYTLPQSSHIFFAITNQSDSNGLVVQRRDSAGNNSSSTSLGLRAVPIWLKVEKRGNIFTFYRSNDGVTWGTALHTYTHPGFTGSRYLYGLALTSHNATTPATAQFSNMQVVLQ